MYDLQLLQKTVSSHRLCLPYLLWMDTPPQHFDTSDGGYEGLFKDGKQLQKPTGCAPLRGVEFDPVSQQLLPTAAADSSSGDGEASGGSSAAYGGVAAGGWRNAIAREAMHRLGVPVVDLWNTSAELWRYHFVDPPRRVDCTHFGQPSAPQASLGRGGLCVWVARCVTRGGICKL